METIPYIVLGTYHPPEWKAWKIGFDLTNITKKFNFIPHNDPKHGPLTTVPWFSKKLHAEVRKRTFNTKKAEDWHFDGDTTAGAKPDCAMVLWATNTPTEIMYKNKIFVPKPYEVVLFKNKSVLHRRPENCPKKRWVFRQRVSVPQHFKLL